MEQTFENVINSLTDLKNQCRNLCALFDTLQYDLEVMVGYLIATQNLIEELVALLEKKG